MLEEEQEPEPVMSKLGGPGNPGPILNICPVGYAGWGGAGGQVCAQAEPEEAAALLHH